MMVDNELKGSTIDRETDQDDEIRDEIDDGTEPATAEDIDIGGGLGAVGGAIVGALAGGPIGALVGAVVGGVASALAVDVVDKHDHDYTETVEENAVIADANLVIEPASVDTALPEEPVLGVVEAPIPSHSQEDLEPLIRERAYALYEMRGRGEGLDLQDWLTAERELRNTDTAFV